MEASNKSILFCTGWSVFVSAWGRLMLMSLHQHAQKQSEKCCKKLVEEEERAASWVTVFFTDHSHGFYSIRQFLPPLT